MSGSRSSTGREFQTDGPATEKARRQYVFSQCRGMSRWWRLEDRRCCRAGTSDTGVQQFAGLRCFSVLVSVPRKPTHRALFQTCWSMSFSLCLAGCVGGTGIGLCLALLIASYNVTWRLCRNSSFDGRLPAFPCTHGILLLHAISSGQHAGCLAAVLISRAVYIAAAGILLRCALINKRILSFSGSRC